MFDVAVVREVRVSTEMALLEAMVVCALSLVALDMLALAMVAVTAEEAGGVATALGVASDPVFIAFVDVASAVAGDPDALNPVCVTEAPAGEVVSSEPRLPEPVMFAVVVTEGALSEGQVKLSVLGPLAPELLVLDLLALWLLVPNCSVDVCWAR